MIDKKSIQEILDQYARRHEQQISAILDFEKGNKPYLVSIPGLAKTVYQRCNTIEDSFEANMTYLKTALTLPSDTLPCLEPWFGTGVYAEAFGCEYFWREGESPACHYKYTTFDQVKNIQQPSIKDGRVFKMILDAIAYFKDRTKGQLPICLTDTQSAHDTATLICDATEVFIASYSDPDELSIFLQKINSLIIEFSKIQIEAIGECLVRPGHIMSNSTAQGRGIAISDDNLAVGSPTVNEKFMLSFDDQLGEAMGGVAIHSCGNWTHTMPLLTKMKYLVMMDCTVSPAVDPNPNPPEAVRDIFKGTDVVVQVRIGQDIEKEFDLVKRLCDKDLRLIVKVMALEDIEKAQYCYKTLNDYLKKLYKV